MGYHKGKAPIFPIRPLLESYGANVPRGRGWRAMCCPFHGDDHASASVNEAVGRFVCHGCMSRSEDAIGLVQHVEGVGYRDAVERCQNIAGSGDRPVRPGTKPRGGLRSLSS